MRLEEAFIQNDLQKRNKAISQNSVITQCFLDNNNKDFEIEYSLQTRGNGL